MPSLNLPIVAGGPIIEVVIGVSEPRAIALAAAKQPVPAGVPARFLIDTGASGTCVDSKILAPLGITPTGSIQVHTPSTSATPAVMSQYDVKLIIPCGAIFRFFNAVPVTECDFSAQNIDGLVGRDVLSQLLLIYNGPMKQYTLSL